MTDTTDLIRKSVTAADHPKQNGVTPISPGYGMWNIIVAPQTPLTTTPGLPVWWTRDRDVVLSSTLDMEDMWSSAVYKAISKRVSRTWEITDTDDSDQRTRRYQKLLLTFDGKRFVPGFSKVLHNFLLTDNGAFVEVVRASNAAGSRILGLMHLDSFRCYRTGDPQRPVVYFDRNGAFHVLKDYQVLDFADQPSPRVEMNGIGRCAASRAFRTILKLAAVEIYFREKITGDRNLAIHIVNGITEDQLKDAREDANDERRRRGYVYYKGSVVIPAIKLDADLKVITIPLAEVPDGFDVDQERKDAYLRYANALGVPVQDIQPLSGQGLGTGTQTVILAEEAEGLGLASFDTDWTSALNESVLPSATTFSWTNPHDTRDQKAKAEVQNAQADVIVKLMGNPTAPGILSQQQALNLASDMDLIPREFLPEEGDATPGGTLASDEKPVEGVIPGLTAPAPAPVPQPIASVPTQKAMDLDALLDDEFEGALAVLRKVADGST